MSEAPDTAAGGNAQEQVVCPCGSCLVGCDCSCRDRRFAPGFDDELPTNIEQAVSDDGT